MITLFSVILAELYLKLEFDYVYVFRNNLEQVKMKVVQEAMMSESTSMVKQARPVGGWVLLHLPTNKLTPHETLFSLFFCCPPPHS